MVDEPPMGSDVYPDKPEAVLVYHASFWTSMSNQLHRSNIRMYIGMCMHVCIETETYIVNNMHYIPVVPHKAVAEVSRRGKL